MLKGPTRERQGDESEFIADAARIGYEVGYGDPEFIMSTIDAGRRALKGDKEATELFAFLSGDS